MFKTLLKKQMMECFSWIFRNKKNQKKNGAGTIILIGVVFALLFLSIGVFFYEIGKTLCGPLCDMGFGWLYILLISMVALILGIIGCVFNTYTTLYNAKDNDMLLSLPIKPHLILITRLISVYITGFVFELIITLPGIVVWFIFGTYSICGAIFTILLPFILSLLILSLSCLLGYVIAIISSKVKNKNLITIIVSICFLVAYFLLYSKMYDLIENLLANANEIANTAKGILYPVYHLGRGAEGNVGSMFISTGIFVAITLLVCFVMSKSFIKLATANTGSRKSNYKKRELKTSNVNKALFIKELKRFLNSPVYLLNCGIGILAFLMIAVLLVVFNEYIQMFASLFGTKEILLLVLVAGGILTASTCSITAPSISLEGKYLWIFRALPISAWQVYKAKLKVHIYLLIIPALAFAIISAILVKVGIIISILSVLTLACFIVLHAEFGLLINLKFPNFNWKSETVPVKQGLSVTIAMFGGWIYTFMLVGLFFLTRKFLSPTAYLAIIFAVILATTIYFYYLLKYKREKKFTTL